MAATSRGKWEPGRSGGDLRCNRLDPSHDVRFLQQELADFHHGAVDEYCCVVRNLTEDDATMQERFTIPRGALELDNTLSPNVSAAKSSGGTRTLNDCVPATQRNVRWISSRSTSKPCWPPGSNTLTPNSCSKMRMRLSRR